MAVVRISKSKIPADKVAEFERLLEQSEATLREPIEGLNGLIHYYVGIDRELGYITNVSVWETLQDAHQMDSLQPMIALRPSFEAAGASFEPITNHETLWTITP
jgi:hypothetical protein